MGLIVQGGFSRISAPSPDLSETKLVVIWNPPPGPLETSLPILGAVRFVNHLKTHNLVQPSRGVGFTDEMDAPCQRREQHRARRRVRPTLERNGADGTAERATHGRVNPVVLLTHQTRQLFTRKESRCDQRYVARDARDSRRDVHLLFPRGVQRPAQ